MVKTSFGPALLALFAATVVVAACGSEDGSATFPGTSSSSGAPSIGDDRIVNDDRGGDGGRSCVPNAGKFEVPGNDCDDDGDGIKDNAGACDGALAIEGNGAEFVKAMGLCKASTGEGDWGLVSAEFLQGHSSSDAPPAGQHGILNKFGSVIRPREGTQLGVLGTGYGREYDNVEGQTPFKNGRPDWPFANYPGAWTERPVPGAFPPGFPVAAQGCPPPQNAFYDPIVLKVVVRAPRNAKGLSFDLNFHSSEWPEFVCSAFNDSFVAYLTSARSPGGAANISFDSQNNPVSVNLGFFDRCDPNVTTGCAGAQGEAPNPKTSVCPGGPAELAGTGFGDLDEYGYCVGETRGGGATGWLTTQAPVEPGETITLEFIIADTADPILDSSILLDNFRWQESETTAGTSRPPN